MEGSQEVVTVPRLGVAVVKQYERGVVFRLGRLRKSASRGCGS